MQKIRSLVLAAGLLASFAAGTTVLTLTQSAAPALAATVSGSSFTSNQAQAASTPPVALTLNFTKVEYKL
jgi:hypothetical protein